MDLLDEMKATGFIKLLIALGDLIQSQNAQYFRSMVRSTAVV